MRIARFTHHGAPTYGVVELASDGGSHPDTVAIVASDPLAGAPTYTGERVDLADVQLLAPVIPPTKVACIGKNYADHISEQGGTSLPPEPIVFFKPTTSVIGTTEAIVRPHETDLLHYEGELVVVFNQTCRRVPEERAEDVIFGYTIANDVTCRDLQAKDGQWSRAKGFDTFCPLGPWIETDLTLHEAGNLHLRTRVNGEVRQDADTSLMLHPIARLIAHVSAFTTLKRGDILLTGTPAGVGEILPGDTVSIEIDRIGTLTNPVIPELMS
ncbi:MAG: fumarylacetoacetate hydrolase family protein [Propionibacteriaceae bacterium]|nr:fumarylacetoacetate hydrolase family protein [Propionibacteriaceae bacterium]